MKPIEKHRFYNLLESDYVRSGLDDTDFSTSATGKLGFKITRAQVTQARLMFKIKNNKKPPMSDDVKLLLTDLKEYFDGLKRKGPMRTDLVQRISDILGS